MAWRLRDVLRKKRWCERCGARLVDVHRCGWREIEQATAAPGEKRASTTDMMRLSEQATELPR